MSKSKTLDRPLVNKGYLMEKMPMKGGWTFVQIPEIKPDKKQKFGWIKVKGFIDDFEIKDYRLMPMGNGNLFLPIKAEIRKKIGKRHGDWVHIVLYNDKSPFIIPEEFLLCLQDEPLAHKIFLSYTTSEQRVYVNWIYAAKKEETRANRIVITINRVLKGLKYGEKPTV